MSRADSFLPAIPNIAIAERSSATDATPKASINQTLFQAKGLVQEGIADARTLHQYLEVEEDYDRWIEGKLVSHKVICHQEYYRVDSGNSEAEKIVVSFAVAQEIAQHEKTRRGAQVKAYLDYHKLLRTSPQEAIRTNLAEVLMNATAAT